MQHRRVLKQITVTTDRTWLENKEMTTMEESLVHGHVLYNIISCSSPTAFTIGSIVSHVCRRYLRPRTILYW